MQHHYILGLGLGAGPGQSGEYADRMPILCKMLDLNFRERGLDEVGE